MIGSKVGRRPYYGKDTILETQAFFLCWQGYPSPIGFTGNSYLFYVYFQIPKTFCARLNSLLSQFWWGGDTHHRKISWTSWVGICRSQFHGGLGFKNFQKFNLCLFGQTELVSYYWCFQSLGTTIKGLYFPWSFFFLGSFSMLSWFLDLARLTSNLCSFEKGGSF